MGAKRLGGKRPGGKRLGGETTRGGNGLGAKRPGFTARTCDNQCEQAYAASGDSLNRFKLFRPIWREHV